MSTASPFDTMLDDARRELDALAGTQQRPASRVSGKPADLSEPERFLNDRYGNGWQVEIAERRSEGDEVVVLCRLTVPEHDITRAQFGRARIGAAEPLGGSSDGVTFSLGKTDAGTGEESSAYAAAERDALAKCVALL
jgi:hypothetical protein